jgi:hypothetical protein
MYVVQQYFILFLFRWSSIDNNWLWIQFWTKCDSWRKYMWSHKFYLNTNCLFVTSLCKCWQDYTFTYNFINHILVFEKKKKILSFFPITPNDVEIYYKTWFQKHFFLQFSLIFALKIILVSLLYHYTIYWYKIYSVT